MLKNCRRRRGRRGALVLIKFLPVVGRAYTRVLSGPGDVSRRLSASHTRPEVQYYRVFYYSVHIGIITRIKIILCVHVNGSEAMQTAACTRIRGQTYRGV